VKRIAIVGASGSHWKEGDKEKVKKTIRGLLKKGDILVSGGCPFRGVDIWAEEVASEMRIEQAIFLPKTNNWSGYKARNIRIARECDMLYDIEPKGRVRSGGIWTMNYAKDIGKDVKQIIL